MNNMDYREALTEWRIGLQLNDRDKALEYAEEILPQIIERAVNMERVLDAVKNYLQWYFRTHDSKTAAGFEVEHIVNICRALENAGMADVCIKQEVRP